MIQLICLAPVFVLKIKLVNFKAIDRVGHENFVECPVFQPPNNGQLEDVWIKQAFRDYYKPKLRRELKRDPTQEEMDRRFEEIYAQVNCVLLAGVYEGVGIYFYEIARFTREEVDAFREAPEEYLKERFGGGNYKLNFYEGPSFIVCVNFKPKGEPRWHHLIQKTQGPTSAPS